MSLEQQGETGMGFCLDFSPSKTVGTATEKLLVGSQDVAYDLPKLKELGVTHILNVGINIANAFPHVSRCAKYMQLGQSYPTVVQCFTRTRFLTSFSGSHPASLSLAIWFRLTVLQVPGRWVRAWKRGY